MSSTARSLSNTSPAAQLLQVQGIVQTVLATLQNGTTPKSLKNVQITASTIDNTGIGGSIPSSAHFTTLVVGFPNISSPVVFYGDNGATLNWSNGLTLTSSPIVLDRSSISSLGNLNVSVSGPTNLNTSSLNLTQNGSKVIFSNTSSIGPSNNNGTLINDPIPNIGDGSLSSSDSGFILENSIFLGLTAASSRFSSISAKSLQVLTSPVIDSQSGDHKYVTSSSSSKQVPLELGAVSATRFYNSFEKIFLLGSTVLTNVTLSANVTISKIYTDASFTSASQPIITLPDGDDDGQIRIVQWILPQLMTQSLATGGAGTTMRITGNFYLQTYTKDTTNPFTTFYSKKTTRVILPCPGSSVQFLFDTSVGAWTSVSNGLF